MSEVLQNSGDQFIGKLAGRAVIVTGGASGIGAATCRAVAQEGGRVAVVDLDVVGAAEVAASLSGGACSFGLDVSDPAAVDQVFDACVASLGSLDVLIHVAGIDDVVSKQQLARHAQDKTPLDVTLNTSNERWQRMIAVNLNGPFYCTRAALRHMTPRGAGAIVLVGSAAGVFGATGLSSYAAAKGGLHAFARSVATEVIRSGVRVNVIAPGAVDTPMLARSSQSVTRGAKPGRPEEIAKVAVFLASDDASLVVGETLLVNGGSQTV